MLFEGPSADKISGLYIKWRQCDSTLRSSRCRHVDFIDDWIWEVQRCGA